MKRGQKITRDDGEQINLRYRYDYQDYDICMKVNKKRKPANRVRKKKNAMVKVAGALFGALLIAIIAAACIDYKAEARELEAYHAEQFEKMAKNEYEEAGGCDTQEKTTQNSFKTSNIRIEITDETEVTLPEKVEEETKVVWETMEVSTNVTEAVEEKSVSNDEYTPKKLSEYEISAEAPYDHYVYILSDEDMKYIAKLVWQEARGEPYEGMVAVAAVVLNRYFSDNPFFYRTSILDTLTQPTQFASVWGVTDWDLNNNPNCFKAVEDACKGWDPTREVFEEGALYFYNPDGVSDYQAAIRQNIRIMVIGNHAFHYDFEKVVG